MDNKTMNYLTLGLLAVGTAASVWYLYQTKNNGQSTGFSRGPVRTRRVMQQNRDNNLGYPAGRKFFGFFGESSAQGANAAGSPPPSVGLFGANRIIRPRGAQSTGNARGRILTGNRPAPAYRATQNGQTTRRILHTAMPPDSSDEF